MPKIKTNSFAKITLLILSFIFIVTGLILLLFVEKIAIITIKEGISSQITIVVQQFLGNAFILLGGLMYTLRNSQGKIMLMTLVFINIMGSINLYLLFKFHDLIILPAIYFSAQLLVQFICLFSLLIELKKTKSIL